MDQQEDRIERRLNIEILAVDGPPQHEVASALHHLINGKEGILQVSTRCVRRT